MENVVETQTGGGNSVRTPGPYQLFTVIPGYEWRTAALTWDSAVEGLQTDDLELSSLAIDESLETNSITVGTDSFKRKVWNAAPAVKSWLQSPSRNNGFAIIAPAPHREIFNSMEAAEAQLRPKLVITYTP